MWNINGDLLATKKIAMEADAITCLAISKGPDWLDTNIIATGHKDSNISIWSCLESSSKRNTDKEENSKIIPYELTNRTQLSAHAKPITYIHIPKSYVNLFNIFLIIN